MTNSVIDYDSLTDTLLWFNQEFYLSFTVKFGSKDKDGNRNFFHKEFVYPASGYHDVNNLVSIKRNYDYFLSIQDVRKITYIQIRVNDMILLQSVLSNIVNILLNDSQWTIKNNKLIFKSHMEPLIVPNLCMNKWISFLPTTIIDFHDTYNKAVRMTLSNSDIFVDIPIEKFMGFVYIINNFNMVEQAAILANYVANQGMYGVNRLDITDLVQSQNQETYEGKKRTIPTKKSFFDI